MCDSATSLFHMDSAYIEITDRCNLNCIFCYNQSGVAHEYHEMSLAELTTAVNNLRMYGAKSISLSGGEPFLHSAWEGISNLITNNADIAFSVVTNGTVNNHYLFQLFEENEKFSVQVSLDGHNETTNSLIRGKGNFYKALATLKRLAKRKKTPVMKLVISRLNHKGIETFMEMAAEIGAVPDFAFVSKIGNAVDNWDNNSLEPVEKVRILNRINKTSKRLDIDVKLPTCANGCPLYDESNPVNVLIKSDGAIHPCQQLYDDSFYLGNILYPDDIEISKNLASLHATAKKRLKTIYNCDRCINRSVCLKGCLADAFYLTGDYLGPDGNCDMRVRQTVDMGIAALFKTKE